MKFLIDDFGVHAIEECLLSGLTTIFTPEIVSELDDEAIRNIAAETEQSIEDRKTANRKLEVLQRTLTVLHRLDRHKPKSQCRVPAMLLCVEVPKLTIPQVLLRLPCQPKMMRCQSDTSHAYVACFGLTPHLQDTASRQKAEVRLSNTCFWTALEACLSVM